MLSFSLNSDQTTYIDMICLCVQDNKNYIRKFHYKDADEVTMQVLDSCIRNVKPSATKIDSYVKTTIRKINKGKLKEVPYDVLNEDGEVALPFMSLVQDDRETIEVGIEEKVNHLLGEMYLINPDYVMELRPIFFGTTLSSKELKKKFTTTDIRIIELGTQLRELAKYKSFMKGVTDFYIQLQEDKSKKKIVSTLKEIKIKDISYDILDYLPEESMICDDKGEDINIDLITLYSEIDLDLSKWHAKYKNLNIQKIDITEYIDYLYSRVFVDKGVNNKVISWATNSNYKLTMPSGVVKLNEDKNKFIELCYRELFLNILNANIGMIIGATPDTIYIKKKGAGLKTLRCNLAYNKTIDLPVEMV